MLDTVLTAKERQFKDIFEQKTKEGKTSYVDRGCREK